MRSLESGQRHFEDSMVVTFISATQCFNGRRGSFLSVVLTLITQAGEKGAASFSATCQCLFIREALPLEATYLEIRYNQSLPPPGQR